MTDLKHYFLILAVGLALTACGEEESHEPQGGGSKEEVTVPYPQTPSSRSEFYALFADEAMVWEESDKVLVWDGTEGRTYMAQSPGTSTILSGDETDASGVYYGFYPAEGGAVTFTEDGKLALTLPQEQTLVPGRFHYNPAVARSSGKDRDFRFRSVCGMLGFTIVSDDVKKVTVVGKNDETIAGEITVDLSDMSSPVWEKVDGKGSREITLCNADGSILEKGTYYMALLPQTFSEGIVISMYNSAGQKAQRVRTKPLEIARGQYLNAGNIDDLETWGVQFHISSLEDFIAFTQKESYDSKADIVLQTDIDLEGVEIGSIKKFDGVFDGNGYKISNWDIKAPLIETLNGTLRNLTVDESCKWADAPMDRDVAVFVTYNNGLVSACVNCADITMTGESQTAHSVAGVVAVTNTRVEYCQNHGDIIVNPDQVNVYSSNQSEGAKIYLGGVVGKTNNLREPVEIVECSNSGRVEYHSEGFIKSMSFVGGVVGGTPGTVLATIESWTPLHNVMIGCTNEGEVVYGYETTLDKGFDSSTTQQTNIPLVGGVAGYWEGDITSAVNSGDITVKAGPVEGAKNFTRGLVLGGVVASASGSLVSCVNSGDINYTGVTAGSPNTSVACGQTGSIAIAGVVGMAGNSRDTRIVSCTNSGDMDLYIWMLKNGTQCAVGGVAGYAYSAISDCANSGDISVGTLKKVLNFGGVAGYAKGFDTRSCNNCGNLSADMLVPTYAKNHSYELNMGGVLGWTDKYIYDCNNSGKLTLRNGWNKTDGPYYRVGGILGNAGAALYHYGQERDYMENTGDIDVETGTNVRVGGIEGTGSGGRLWYTRNRGNISVKAGYTACYVGGLRGYTSGQVQSSENLGSVSVETSSTRTAVGGILGYMGATQINNTNQAGDVTLSYNGTSSGTVYFGQSVGWLACYCTVAGTYTGNLMFTNPAGASDQCVRAIVGYGNTGLNNPVTFGHATCPLSIAAGKTINGVTVNSNNYNDRRFLLGGVKGVDYILSDTNVIALY